MFQIGVPIDVFLATSYDKFRKPEIGMWEFLISQYKETSNAIEKEMSFFVGDAAGRPRDFSDSDKSDAFVLVMRLTFFQNFCFKCWIVFQNTRRDFCGDKVRSITALCLAI